MSTAQKEYRILIVDDEEKIRAILTAILSDEGYTVRSGRDGIEALELAESFKPHLLIVDLQMPRMDGIETLVRIREKFPNVLAVILTAHGTIQSAVDAIKKGAYDYLTKPFDNEQILLVVRRALDLSRLSLELEHLERELGMRSGVDCILGESAVIQNLRSTIKKMAETDATVLIEGESGTGKELAARAVHFESKRKRNPFIVVDCTSIPSNLFESTLFGHERGAFTDAKEQRPGKFEEADGGTVFLDEIGELPLEAQTKLLRVLQEKEFARVGGNAPIQVDVRVIAATNRNLDQLVRDHRFREDLFYRLNVLKLSLLPLRDHREDIPLYAAHFITKHQTSFGKNVLGLNGDALQVLLSREWRGNVRELENTVQRGMLNAATNYIEAGDLEFLYANQPRSSSQYDPREGLEAHIKSLTQRVEREIILKTLGETGWNRTEAALRLMISRKTLFNKMVEYGIEQEGRRTTESE